MNYAIFLSGGIGSRFWPLSRNQKPKQFLSLYSDRPIIEESIRRVGGLIRKENIYVAGNKMHRQACKKYLRGTGVPPQNFFFEPEGKNTLAPIAYLARKIHARDKNAVIAVMPCDHLIRGRGLFLRALRSGITAARSGYIVTLGIPPTRPETGYGYIKIRSPMRGQQLFAVDRFIEKPPLARAKKFLKEGRYYWNSGIFIFQPQVMLGEVKQFLPLAYKIIMRLEGGRGFARLWRRLPAISVDYAVMEKTRRGAVVPARFGWKELGSWQAVEDLIEKDKDGNIFRGNCLDIAGKNILVWGGSRLVATLGLKDTVVVDTSDAILVCAKNRIQDVKQIVQLLKKRKLTKQL